MFDFSKLAPVCKIKNCVAIATERVIFGQPGNFIGGKCMVYI